jgi:hypothetical protein
MKLEIKKPEKTYPYLAYWTGDYEPRPTTYNDEDVVVINRIEKENEIFIYVMYLHGNKEGYFTKNEKEYTALPIGTEVKIIQS